MIPEVTCFRLLFLYPVRTPVRRKILDSSRTVFSSVNASVRNSNAAQLPQRDARFRAAETNAGW